MWGWLLGFLALTSPHFGCMAAAREQDVSPQLLQKFMQLIPPMGLTKDMLAILPKSGEWPEDTGWQVWPLCVGTAQGLRVLPMAHSPLSLLSDRSMHQGHQVSVARESCDSLPAWSPAEQGLAGPGRFPTCLRALSPWPCPALTGRLPVLPLQLKGPCVFQT